MLDLVRSGATVPDVVLELYGLRPSRGRPYMTASAAVMAVIRDALPPPLTVVAGDADDEDGT